MGALVQHRPADAPAGPPAPGRSRGRVLPAGQGRRVTAASPLRGPKSMEGGGFAAAHLRARRAGCGAAPPASRALRVSCGNGLRPPLTPETSAAPGAGKAGRPGPAPARRGAQAPRRGGRLRIPGRQEQSELAFDNQKEERKNYTNTGPGSRPGSLITAEPPGEAASHKTRCARNPGCSRITYLAGALAPTPGSSRGREDSGCSP